MKAKATLILIILFLSMGCTYGKGTINIETDPPGAEVYVDGKKVGETPAAFDYDLHRKAIIGLTIKKDNYYLLSEVLSQRWVEDEYRKGNYEETKAMKDGKMRTVWTVTTYRKLDKISETEPHTLTSLPKIETPTTKRTNLVAPNAKLAVMDLKAKYGVEQMLAEGLSVVIRDTIQGMGDYEVLSKDDVELIAERTAIRQSLGCDDTKCLIDIGRSLGSKFMVAGDISKFGETYNISLRLIDTMGEEAGVKRRTNRNCKCAEDELIEAARVIASQLLE